ncbi:MAG: DNA mismatch repair protein MutS, partial [Dinghuibacter sp.]|nr:DNA mismatch repair protein MutS [Dinghuibacter sp.]
LALHLAGIIPTSPFYLFIMVAFVFSYSISKKITKEYGHLSKILPELESLLPALRMMEQTTFNSSYITSQQKMLAQHGAAAQQIARLKKILDRFDYRLNPVVHIPLNILLLWDLQQALSLQQWKISNTAPAKQWYAVLGEMEALSSLAALHFNHPDWAFPEITEQWFTLECIGAGHPLIPPQKLVPNNFSLSGTPKIALVTGSNMAGKSTFLRTIGANIVLAMAGAPVCATTMRLPVTRVMSSMRITDNLEEETSTFYAELKKLKWIIGSVQKKEKVFLLLDEMLRGTNSLDRHTGSEALIRQLVQEGAVGIIASHDVELSRLEQEFPHAINNYHFDSAVVQEEIIFDYRLKTGVCTSTNATLLMKKIGIRM